MRNATALGAIFATITGLAWGGQFVVGASALHRVDAFPLTTLRYAIAGGTPARVACAARGEGAFRLEGRGLRLFGLGTLGFAGFNLLAYTGLAHARPQSASLIVALAPLVTALVLWQRTRVRPSASTFAFARSRADGRRARDQRWASDDDRHRLDRLGRRARARRGRELRHLRARCGAHA